MNLFPLRATYAAILALTMLSPAFAQQKAAPQPAPQGSDFVDAARHTLHHRFQFGGCAGVACGLAFPQAAVTARAGSRPEAELGPGRPRALARHAGAWPLGLDELELLDGIARIAKVECALCAAGVTDKRIEQRITAKRRPVDVLQIANKVGEATEGEGHGSCEYTGVPVR